MRWPLILFIVVPMTELLILFEVAERIGGVYTLLLVVTTAFIGVTILKRQGLGTLRRADLRMQQGQLPAQEIVEGMLLAMAGAMLLTPGLITDVAGFTLLAPPSRRAIARRILRSGTSFFVGGFSTRGGFHRPGEGPGSGSRGADGRTVDGEYRREDDPRDRLDD
ncbi:MAG: FxsA family protein [Pseudohongiellaceae bacterium]